MNSISLTYQEYIEIWEVLEELRVSLDRIGVCDDKAILQEKLLDYLTSGVYAKIADAANLMEAKLPREESIKIAEKFGYYDLHKPRIDTPGNR